jgi:hypothetical protein
MFVELFVAVVARHIGTRLVHSDAIRAEPLRANQIGGAGAGGVGVGSPERRRLAEPEGHCSNRMSKRGAQGFLHPDEVVARGTVVPLPERKQGAGCPSAPMPGKENRRKAVTG